MVKSLIENFIFCGVEKVANVARNETLFQVPSVSLLKFSMPTFFEEKQGDCVFSYIHYLPFILEELMNSEFKLKNYNLDLVFSLSDN